MQKGGRAVRCSIPWRGGKGLEILAAHERWTQRSPRWGRPLQGFCSGTLIFSAEWGIEILGELSDVGR